jgi:hypothetical protein
MIARRQFSEPAPGVCLDDFVERTFQHDDTDFIWLKPWVGIFHHPPNIPDWFDPRAPLQKILGSERFVQSQPYLRGAIVLSRYLGDWLAERLDIPVRVIPHPTECSVPVFDVENWLAQEQPNIVQVGWYLRNYRAIYQLDTYDLLTKMHLFQDRPWITDAMGRTDLYSQTRHRPDHQPVKIIGRLSNPAYDDLLSTSIVLGEYFDVSASNTVIECMARNTPLVTNRHPALEEYLGKEYPLFYKTLDEAAHMAVDRERVIAAHQWLSELDKSSLDGSRFVEQVLDFMYSVE